MTLQELKKSIIDKSYSNVAPIIFICKNTFIADQYSNQISKIINLPILYLKSISEVLSDEVDLFGTTENNVDSNLYIYKTEEFSCIDKRFLDLKNIIVICNKIDDATKVIFQNFIINIPKLEEWQISDYIEQKLDGIHKNKLTWLHQICGDNIYRVLNEINKLCIFSKSEREHMFDLMVEEDLYSDLTNYDIFNLSRAINEKDIDEIKNIYLQKDCLDIHDLALLVLLCNNFRNNILVKLNMSPTTNNTGLSDKQIYAIQKSKCKYSTDELIAVFKKLNSIDEKIKSGLLPESLLLDYILINVLGE